MKKNKTIDAIFLTLKSRKHLLLVVLSSLLMLLITFVIPIVTIPGNSIELQFSITTWDSALLAILFSSLFGLSVGMHAYASTLNKLHKNRMIAHGAGTGFFSVVGTIFAGKLCPLCLSTIFSFVGLGSSAVFFVLSYRTEILALSIMLILISIYFAGKRTTNFCDNCKK